MNIEIKIIEDTQKLLSEDRITQSDVDEIFDKLDKLLFSETYDSKKFGVLLNTKIVDKLFNEVTGLENEISKLGNSRSNLEKKQNLIAKENILNNLMIKLFTSYSDYLNKSEAYKVFANTYLQRVEDLCQNLLNRNVNEEYPFPEYYDKSNANRIITEIEEYYKKIFLNPENTVFVKTRLTKLSDSLKIKIVNVENEIGIWKQRKDKYQKKLLSFSNEQSEEKDRTFDLYDCEMTGVINLLHYKNDIVNLYNHIVDEYPFINSKPITISDITVFGNSNLDIIKYMYSEYSDFIDETVTDESNFVQTFMDLPVTHKINLINGSLPDYAYFIKSLKPFFISKYKDDSGVYNQWWSDRFLFSGKEKTKRDISNMISALDKGRGASKKSATKNIVDFLSSSYHRPT